MSDKKKFKNPTQDAIKNLSESLIQFIHYLYQITIRNTIRDGNRLRKDPKYLPADILSIAKHHKAVCQEADCSILPEKDQAVFNLYQKSLDNTIFQRTYTALMTKFLINFVDLIMWINIWINYSENRNFSVQIIARRKGLCAEFMKSLLKCVEMVYNDQKNMSSQELKPPPIRDLFGVRCILPNYKSVSDLKFFVHTVQAILTDPNSSEYADFYNWVETTITTFGGMSIPKKELLRFKEYSFEFSNTKNYVVEPKGTYQSWQTTITIKSSPGGVELCEKMLEFQARTFGMHKNATTGAAKQDDYKEKIYSLIERIFSIDYYTGGIDFYDFEIGPNGEVISVIDENGVVKPVIVCSRNSSQHVMPDTGNAIH